MEPDAHSGPAHTRTLAVRVEQTGARPLVGARRDPRSAQARAGADGGRSPDRRRDPPHARRCRDRGRAGAALTRIRAEQPSVAFEASPGTGGECCRDPVSRSRALAGCALDAGFAKRLGARDRRSARLLARADPGALRRLDRRAGARRRPRAPRRGPLAHRASASSSAASRSTASPRRTAASSWRCSWPTCTARRRRAEADPFAKLARHFELRVNASVDLDTLTLRRVGAAERSTEPGSESTLWRDARRGRRVARRSGRHGRRRQRGARALRRRGRRAAARRAAQSLADCRPVHPRHLRALALPRERDAAPGMFASGGMLDSCYMWRRGGFLAQRIDAELHAFRKAGPEREG